MYSSVLVIVFIIVTTVFIWGIVAAIKTKDVQYKVGKILLHVFLWGGLIAAIVYVVKVNSNINKLNNPFNIDLESFNNPHQDADNAKD